MSNFSQLQDINDKNISDKLHIKCVNFLIINLFLNFYVKFKQVNSELVMVVIISNFHTFQHATTHFNMVRRDEVV